MEKETFFMQRKNKSQYIIHDLRKKILSGELPKNYQFETLPKFAASMGTTVATMDKVFTVLQNEGLIERINGKGIFVLNLESTYSNHFVTGRNPIFTVIFSEILVSFIKYSF